MHFSKFLVVLIFSLIGAIIAAPVPVPGPEPGLPLLRPASDHEPVRRDGSSAETHANLDTDLDPRDVQTTSERLDRHSLLVKRAEGQPVPYVVSPIDTPDSAYYPWNSQNSGMFSNGGGSGNGQQSNGRTSSSLQRADTGASTMPQDSTMGQQSNDRIRPNLRVDTGSSTMSQGNTIGQQSNSRKSSISSAGGDLPPGFGLPPGPAEDRLSYGGYKQEFAKQQAIQNQREGAGDHQVSQNQPENTANQIKPNQQRQDSYPGRKNYVEPQPVSNQPPQTVNEAAAQQHNNRFIPGLKNPSSSFGSQNQQPPSLQGSQHQQQQQQQFNDRTPTYKSYAGVYQQPPIHPGSPYAHQQQPQQQNNGGVSQSSLFGGQHQQVPPNHQGSQTQYQHQQGGNTNPVPSSGNGNSKPKSSWFKGMFSKKVSPEQQEAKNQAAEQKRKTKMREHETKYMQAHAAYHDNPDSAHKYNSLTRAWKKANKYSTKTGISSSVPQEQPAFKLPKKYAV